MVRAHSDEEVSYLRELGANEVIIGDREIGRGMVGWTNGEAAHELNVRREEASFSAVAKALKLDAAPAPLPAAPQLVAEAVLGTTLPETAGEEASVDAIEAGIEAAHPAHEISGPAEPAELVPALGEMPEAEEGEVVADVVPEADAEAGEVVPDVVAEDEAAAELMAEPVFAGVPRLWPRCRRSSWCRSKWCRGRRRRRRRAGRGWRLLRASLSRSRAEP